MTSILTRNEKTKADYDRVVKGLYKTTAQDSQLKLKDVTLQEVVANLLDRHKSLSASAWRQYRAALSHAHQDLVDKSVLAPLHDVSGGGRRKAENQVYGATKKMKSFPVNMFSAVMGDLNRKLRKKNQNAAKLSAWLYLGLHTGLRPIEWAHAVIVSGESGPLLKVKNAKNSNERANGEYRHLDLSWFEVTEDPFMGILTQQLDFFKSLRETCETDEIYMRKFNAEYDIVRYVLSRTVKRLFPGRKTYPSLYSLRHQFIANCKADELSLKEIAALCGQASAETPSKHYGKKRYGNAGVTRIKPLPQEVLTVTAGEERLYDWSNRADPNRDIT